MSLVLGAGPQRSGLLALVAGVVAFLQLPFVLEKYAYEGVRVPVVATTGWHQRERQDNGSPDAGANRICFLPGWGLSGPRAHGTLTGPARTSAAPRTLYTRVRQYTTSVWSFDPSAPDDESAQIAASDTLLELHCQAIGTAHAVVGGISTPGRVYQDAFSANRPFGVELLVEWTLQEPIYDLPTDVITDVRALIKKEDQWPPPA